jgi:hypothetical protein
VLLFSFLRIDSPGYVLPLRTAAAKNGDPTTFIVIPVRLELIGVTIARLGYGSVISQNASGPEKE